MIVTNMKSPQTGKAVANQFIITTEQGEYFQSYESMIAFVPRYSGRTVLDEKYWDYSTTTSKYRNMFLSDNTSETRRKIKDGEYVLQDLNKGE